MHDFGSAEATERNGRLERGRRRGGKRIGRKVASDPTEDGPDRGEEASDRRQAGRHRGAGPEDALLHGVSRAQDERHEVVPRLRAGGQRTLSKSPTETHGRVQRSFGFKAGESFDGGFHQE